MLNIKNKKIEKNHILLLFIEASFIFAIPSIIYYIKHKTILNFESWFKFLLSDSMDSGKQAILYLVILSILTIFYFLIIKNRKEIFDNIKKMFIFISIVSVIFMMVIPFTSSDIFYYLGIGRLDSKYHQNPYYESIKDFVESENNIQYIEQDTVLEQGYTNYWSETTVIYGPIWTLICKGVSSLSFGNIDIGLFVFKLVNVIIHLLNCYLIYRISNRKAFTLIYGINPFILIEGIACVHNDIYMIFFILIALYFLVKKKNIVFSVAFLAIATAIKYFSVILLPFIIIYYFRKEKPSIRFLKCIQYGILFLVVLAIPYLFYIRDLQVFSGLFVQQEKITKNFYIILTEYFDNISINELNRILLACFAIAYLFCVIDLLTQKEIKFKNEIQNANYFIMVFLFLLITNFQPWYIMWLFPCLMWQKAKIVRLTIYISLASQFANAVFLAYGEGWRYGTPFTFIFVVSTLLAYIIYNERKHYIPKEINIKRRYENGKK